MDISRFVSALKKRGDTEVRNEEGFVIEVRLKGAKVSFELKIHENPTAKKYSSFTIKISFNGSKTKRTWHLDVNYNFHKAEAPKTSFFDLLMWIESQFDSNTFSTKAFIRGISCNEFREVIDLEAHQSWIDSDPTLEFGCVASYEEEIVYLVDYQGLNIKLKGANTSRYFLGFLKSEGELPDPFDGAFRQWIEDRGDSFVV